MLGLEVKQPENPRWKAPPDNPTWRTKSRLVSIIKVFPLCYALSRTVFLDASWLHQLLCHSSLTKRVPQMETS